MNFLSFLHKFIISDSKLITYYQFVRFGSNILLAIIFSKYFYNPQKLSEYETLVLSISTFVFFWNTGFIRFFQSYFPQFHQISFNSFLSQILTTSMIVGLVTFGAFNILQNRWDFLTALIGIKIFTSIISNPLEYYWIASKKHYWVFGLINSYFSLFIFWTVYAYLYLGIESMLLGWISLDTLKFLFFAKKLNFSFKTFEKPLLSNLFFLSLSALLSGGVEYINFWLVKSYYSDIEFIIYRYGAREIPFSALMAYGLSAALSAQIQTQDLSYHNVKTKITKLLHFTFPITIFLLLISNVLFQFLYGKDIAQAAKVFDIFLLLNISRVLLFDIYLLANQKHRFFLFTAIMEILIVSFISGLGIYYSWKVEYLGFSVFVAYLLERFILALKVKTLDIKITHFFPMNWWLMYSLLTLGIYLAKHGFSKI